MVSGNYGKGFSISDIYQGGYSSLNPPSDSYMTAGSLGMTTDPRVANILQEVSSKLSSGTKNIEVEGIMPEKFDSIPKQHLKEVNRLAKLTGVDISLHGPLLEPSGIQERGYSEVEREIAQRKVSEALFRSKELNPNGNIPVTFHSSNGIPGSQFIPDSIQDGKTRYHKLIAINREDGRMIPLETEKQYTPGIAGPVEVRELTPERRMKSLNITKWDNEISQVLFQKERADEILERNRPFIQHLILDIENGKINLQDLRNLSKEQYQAFQHYQNARVYLDDLHLQANNLFSKAYQFSNEDQKKKLDEISKNFGDFILKSVDPKAPIPNPFVESEAFQGLLHNLKNPEIAPEMFVPLEKFSTEKSGQTFGKSAFSAYKEFGDNAPVLVIENPPAGGGLSTGEDIRNIVEESRKNFIEEAKKEGISEAQASKAAKKLIGATWDVGHINMLRKFGYTEKDIIRETEKVAPYVKHLHLSDNFGFEHTELPMGMGNVPLKEIMDRLGEKGFEGKKIIEASSWWEHFKTPPFQETLEAVGSPIYSMKMSPYWSQSPGFQEGYFSGYGQMLPQINYETFGAGFSRLPSELGGSVQGLGGGRMSGRSME
ncbi:sugar phosphate isomerase/epimerase [Patescibacteria group bacterium]|nr:sugar phosphate isomerase/epimerase [Patescibacteria group bacterium]